MKHKQVKKLFQQWNDGRVEEPARPRIQAHLDACDECREYYEKMALLLAKPDAAGRKRLEPDPFLPARIRAIARESAAPPAPARRFGVLRTTAVTAMLIVAIAAGVFLGHELSAISRTNGDTDLAAAYYSTVAQEGFADDLQTIVTESKDEL